MGRFIIEPKDQEEKALIQSLLKKMNINAQYLSEAELEDYVIAHETIEGAKHQRTSEESVLNLLKEGDGG